MDDLKPCPFCGSKKLKIQCIQKKIGVTGICDFVVHATYSVRCNVCHARGSIVGGKVILTQLRQHESELPDWASSRESLKEKAIEAWNKGINTPEINEQSTFHGHWIGQPISGTACCECSICGAVCNVYASAGIPTQKYCYRCGALMLEDK